MKFVVDQKVFEVLPEAYFGVVAVAGLDNHGSREEIAQLLQSRIAQREEAFEGVKVRECAELAPYREAFLGLGQNPNKFLCSIEALLTRIAKKKGFPSISPAVDLGNAVSIGHCLPIGAHDMDTVPQALEVRFAREGDDFVAFGETEEERPDAGELLYVSGSEIRTRRWIWRQSEVGKITPETTRILYPIDGFLCNQAEVLAARDELAALLQARFGVTPVVGFVDRDNRSFEADL